MVEDLEEEIKIDNDVPYPGPLKYRYQKSSIRKCAEKMKIGDSVLFKSKSRASSLVNCINKLANQNRENVRASMRSTNQGVRVWKIEREIE